MDVSMSSQSHQHLFLPIFFMDKGCEVQYLILGLICVFLLVNDVEKLFMGLFFISSLKKCLFKSVAHF